MLEENTEMIQFEEKISKENKNDPSELGWVIIAFYKKNMLFPCICDQ